MPEREKADFTTLVKFKRRTVPFGAWDPELGEYEDEMYMREMNISFGASTGCAIWDSAVILCRWVYVSLIPPIPPIPFLSY